MDNKLRCCHWIFGCFWLMGMPYLGDWGRLVDDKIVADDGFVMMISTS